MAAGSLGSVRCQPPAGEGQKCDPAPFALWYSPDLSRWTRVVLAPEPYGSFWSLASDQLETGAWRVLLAGDNLAGAGVLWSSADGQTWNSTTSEVATGVDGHFNRVVAGPGGFAIAGYTGGHRPHCCDSSVGNAVPTLWTSADGLNWRRAALPGADSLAGNDLARLLAGSDGWLAISDANVSDAAYWHSSNGVTWTAVDRPDGTNTPVPLASDGARMLGRTFVASDAPAAYWIGTGDGIWTRLVASGDTDSEPTWEGDATESVQFILPDGIAFLGSDSRGSVAWSRAQLAGVADGE